jgi:hypothetical protein
VDTARHRKRRRAYFRFSLSMFSNVRSYVSSKLFGNSSKTLWILAGKLRRSLSIWQTTQRNLPHHVSTRLEAAKVGVGLHPISLLREGIDNQLLVLLPPLLHFLV